LFDEGVVILGAGGKVGSGLGVSVFGKTMGAGAGGGGAGTGFLRHPEIASTALTLSIQTLLRIPLILIRNATDQAACVAIGNLSRNTVPFPVSLVKSIVPLWSCTARNVMASPIPEPLSFVVKYS